MQTAKLKKSVEHVLALEEKLQNAFNENAKLKVQQQENEKLWKGLGSKFTSTKTLCDQLTETLQQLSSLVQAGRIFPFHICLIYLFFTLLNFIDLYFLADSAEKDKETLENKLSASSNALDSLNKQMDDLSLKLGSAEEMIRTRKFFSSFHFKFYLFFAKKEKKNWFETNSCICNLIEEFTTIK